MKTADRRQRSPSRLLLQLGALALVALESPDARAETPCFPIPVGMVSRACLSWSHQDVLGAAPAEVSGSAFSIRVVGLLPDGSTVYDRTIDTLEPPSESPELEEAMALARSAIHAAVARPVTVSEPRLVESSSRQVTSAPLGMLLSRDTVARQAFYYTADRGASYCVGDLGEAPGLPTVLRNASTGTCPSQAFVVGVGGFCWRTWYPPYCTYYTGFLDDTHLHLRFQVDRSALLAGTLITLRYELTGEDPDAGAAGRAAAEERR